MKVASIVGTRPQFIKLSPLSRKLRKRFNEVIIHTGQHYDSELSHLFFKELDIPEPDYNLGVGSGLHGWQTGEMIKRIEEKLIEEDPDLAIVYGDSNTTLAGALAAVKLEIPVAHVEAGCRTYNLSQPEEVNRVVTDHISSLLFAITKGTVSNLVRENINSDRVFLTGSTIVDACIHYAGVAESKSDILERLGLEKDGYCLATAHRPQNVDFLKPLSEIVKAFSTLNRNLVFPIHPRTMKNLLKFRLMKKLKESKNVIILPPLGYLDFIKLLNNAKLILSDSGSIQQEAMVLRKRCVRFKMVDPFPELGEYIAIKSVSPCTKEILKAADELMLLDDESISHYENPLGEGYASRIIAEVITEWGS